MKNKLILYMSLMIISLIFISCKQKTHQIKKHYYASGELLSEISIRIKDSLKDGIYKEYYRNGKIKQLMNFNNNVQSDSGMMYYETGVLKFKQNIKGDTIFSSHYYKETGGLSSLGKFLNTKPPVRVGWTQVFNKEGIFTDSLKYINVNGETILNQRIHYNEDNLIELDSSIFYKMRVSKIKNSDNYQFKINYFPSVKDATIIMITGNEINADFSNLSSTGLDSLLIEKNVLIKNNLKESYRKLKGFFYEYKAKVKHEVGQDSVRMSIYEKKTYFDEHIKVTDTIELEK